MKNWKQIKSVYIKDYLHGTLNGRGFNSLKDFVLSNEYYIIRNRLSEHPHGNCLTMGGFCFTDKNRYNVLDDSGVIIPLWKIQETYDNLPNINRVSKCRWFVGSKNRWRFSAFYRTPKTFSAKRDSSFVQFDEDCIDYDIRVRGRRNKNSLPCAWDDYQRSDIRDRKNWKQRRKTQYKA